MIDEDWPDTAGASRKCHAPIITALYNYEYIDINTELIIDLWDEYGNSTFLVPNKILYRQHNIGFTDIKSRTEWVSTYDPKKACDHSEIAQFMWLLKSNILGSNHYVTVHRTWGAWGSYEVLDNRPLLFAAKKVGVKSIPCRVRMFRYSWIIPILVALTFGSLALCMSGVSMWFLPVSLGFAILSCLL
jgi:hypothetical protein